jgi:hypothetical protein
MSWRSRADVIVQVGLRGESVGEMVWDSSDWDDATWSGLEPTWAELIGWTIEGVATRRGRTSGASSHPAGTAEIRLVWQNPNAGWSFRPGAPFQIGQELRVLVRGRALADGTPITDVLPLYRGTIRELRDGWQPEKSGHMLFRLTARLVDRFADLGSVDLPEQALAAGLNDTTDERIARILDLAEIDTYYLRANACVVHHQSSTFARNLLDEAQVTIKGEPGDFYVDREGFFYVRERLGTGAHEREDEDQISWTNDPDTAGIGPLNFGTGQALDELVNQVSMARVGGTAYTTRDTDSRVRYGLRTYQFFDLTCRYDADVEYAADYRLEQLHRRTQRVDEITAPIHELMPDDDLAALLDVEIGDRHAMTWNDGGEDLMTGTFHVQGVAHTITGSTWVVGVDLWSQAGEGLRPPAARWSSGLWSVGAWG